MTTFMRDNGIWDSSASDSTGRVVLGIGTTEQQSIDQCQDRLYMRETFLSLSPRAQLTILVGTDKDLLSQELSDSVKLIAQIILEDK